MAFNTESMARVRRAPYLADLDMSDIVARNGSQERAESSSSPRSAKQRRQLGKVLPSAADFYVPSLPGLPNMSSHPTHPLNLYAGNLPSYPGENKGGGEGQVGKDATIFFMMARARRTAGKQRVIFWFNGGPGCSSFDGSLMEIGPFRTVPGSQTEDGKPELKLVEGGWEEYATVVFIDQPPGTGFSTVPVGGYITELPEAAQHLITFLHNFYRVFPELAGQDTYLAGESYAGQYIPYFADALLKTDQLPNFHLSGIAIGNGWIDPKRQYPAYAEFAYEKGLIKKGTDEAKRLDAEVEKCDKALERYTDDLSTPTNIFECDGIMGNVVAPYKKDINGETKCMNIYDVRLMDTYPQCGMNWPPDLTDVYSFLARDDVVAALHATDHTPTWVECNNRVGQAMRQRKSPAAIHLIPSIIERGVKTMMFAGDEDLICNNVGIERMVDAMKWNGEVGMGNVTTQKWTVNGTEAGEWTTSRNLTYVRVFGASHMVGFDVPDVTNDMIMRFMDVDINLLPGRTGEASSKVGDDERLPVHFGEVKEDTGIPILKGGAGDWESWYNAISAVLILLTLGAIVAGYLYFRRRKGKKAELRLPMRSLSLDQDREERVPLAAEDYEMTETIHDRDDDDTRRKGKGKGKQRAEDDDESDAERGQTVFALGDEDDH